MFSRLFRKKPESPPVSTAQSTLKVTSAPSTGVAKPMTPVYPPVDKGINLDPVADIVASQAEFIKRLRILAGGDEKYFEEYFGAVIHNLAEYIHLLPASREDAHPGAGGLFRLCLEMGFFAMQASEKYVFAGNESVELRRILEPRWKYATFLAALCRELYRPLSDVIVTDAHGNQWPKHLSSLMTWAQGVGAQTYFLNWQGASKSVHTMVAGRSDVAAVMIKILPQYALQYLEDGSPKILPVVFAVASGSAHPADNAVAKIVHETREKVIQRDRALRPQQYGKLQVGNHLAPYLLDAMRQLYKGGTWTVNAEKSRMWLAPHGLFLIWKSAGKEILSTLAETGVTGAPKDISTLAEMMADAKIIELNGKEPIWMIKPPGAKDAYQAVKIAQPITILEDDQVEPVEIQFQDDGSSSGGNKPVPDTQAPQIAQPAVETAPKATRAKPKKDPANGPAPIDSNTDVLALAEDDGLSSPPADANESGDDGPPESVPEPWEVESPKPNPGKTVNADAGKREAKQPRQEADKEAVIAPVMAQESYAGNLPEKARAQLEKRPDLLEVFGKMVHDYQTGRHKDKIFDVPQGIAFETQQVLKYGLPFDRIVGALYENRWIESPAGNPNAKMMKVMNPKGAMVSAIVINSTGLDYLGFRPAE